MRTRKGLFYTVCTDTFLVLMAIFMFVADEQGERASAMESLAGVLASENDELRVGLGRAQFDLSAATDELGRAKSALGDTRRRLQAAIKDGANKDALIDGLGKQVGDLRGANAQLSDENKELRSHLRSGDAVTVVVLIDTTPSMNAVLVQLRQSLRTLFEFMPNTSKDFRVGVLAFQKGVVAELPITQVLPIYADGGRSQKAVLEFVDGLTTAGDQTDHLPVFQEAIRWIESAHRVADPDRKERLILLGDVGPSEIDRTPGYTRAERKIARRIVSGVRAWASRGGDRAVESLYARSDFTKTDPGASESREWFGELGRVSPKSAYYTDADALLRAVLHASLD